MKSVMQHNFSQIPQTDIERSTFDRSHGVKTAFQSGYLVPIFCDEVLPGDTFRVDATMLTKLFSPLQVPIMDNIFVETQWFFCPSRLLWTNFTKMMGERVNPNDSIDYTVPTMNSGDSGFAIGSLADYLGVPTDVANLDVNSLPFRMYQKVWDEWYRDENLQDSVIQSTDMLGDSTAQEATIFNVLRKRGKRHDYFTSCLPSPQKGVGASVSLTGSAPVYPTGDAIWLKTGKDSSGKEYKGVVGSFYGNDNTNLRIKSPKEGYELEYDTELTNTNSESVRYPQSVIKPLAFDESKQFGSVDLSSASVITINSLRTAFQIQRLLEADARGGTRYVELIRNLFKTICPDARLQRSEYLGGSSQLLNVDAVNTTGAAVNVGTTVVPLGWQGANAKCFGNAGWSKSFTEHGYILGLVSVRCDLNYQQGLNRMFSRKTRYDFYFPTLAHLGEQAVLNKEIYAQGGDVKDDDGNVVDDKVFGYQERYAEYRYKPSIITGAMRSSASIYLGLDVFHLAQNFTELPKLDGDFIEDNPPISRVVSFDTASPVGTPEFLFDGYIKCICTRPMPVYSIPGLIDHF